MSGVIENIAKRESWVVSWSELIKVTNSTPPTFIVGGLNIELIIFTHSIKLILAIGFQKRLKKNKTFRNKE